MRALNVATLRRHALTLAVAVTAAVLVVDFVYLYFVKFDDFVHSDAASTVIMAKGALACGLPVDLDWYFANGDVWLFAPHLYAMPLVAIWGISVRTLLAAVVFGFLLEVGALMWTYTKIGADRRTAVLATALTLIAWSRLHILFVYIELSYGFVASLYLTLFAAHALLFDRQSPKAVRSAWIACALFTFVTSAQNPVRAVVFAIAPLVLACAWPWRGVTIRTRLLTASAPVVGLLLAKVLQKLVLQRYFTFSVPSGHLDFVVRDGKGILQNAADMGRGIVGLVGDMSSFGVGSAFGLALLVVSLFIVVRHVLSRTASRLRFVCIAALGQLAAVAGPMLFGNLVVNPVSIRYVMPSLIGVIGLAAVIAVELVRERRRAGIVFCAIAPVAAALSILRIIGSYSLAQESTTGQFAHVASHQDLADELNRRGLRHGFATYWNAHLLTLLSNGHAKTCPATFGGVVIPRRWHTDTWCFEPARLPERFFIVGAKDEAEDVRTSVAATFGTPAERFSVGDAFDVTVYRTADVSSRWLTPPLPEPDRLRLPLRIEAGHPQMRIGDNAALEAGRIVGKGSEGNMSFGPYIDLPPGDYRVRWMGTPLVREGEVGFDVVASGAKDRLAERSVKLAELGDGDAERTIVELSLHLEKRTNGVELRTFSRGGARVALAAVEISR